MSPSGTDTDAGTMETVAERFHNRHRRRYGHAYEDEPIELVTIRLRARGVVATPDLRTGRTDGNLTDAVKSTREVVFDGVAHDTPVYDRAALPTEVAFGGPAIVEGAESTVVVRPGQTARVDDYGSIVVEVDP